MLAFFGVHICPGDFFDNFLFATPNATRNGHIMLGSKHIASKLPTNLDTNNAMRATRGAEMPWGWWGIVKRIRYTYGGIYIYIYMCFVFPLYSHFILFIPSIISSSHNHVTTACLLSRAAQPFVLTLKNELGAYLFSFLPHNFSTLKFF